MYIPVVCYEVRAYYILEWNVVKPVNVVHALYKAVYNTAMLKSTKARPLLY